MEGLKRGWGEGHVQKSTVEGESNEGSVKVVLGKKDLQW